eukprot:Hpha_TRINITY_DN12666_c0_g1::TRINITY_DN12666_c0_g1_i1::g.49573::m.49573
MMVAGGWREVTFNLFPITAQWPPAPHEPWVRFLGCVVLAFLLGALTVATRSHFGKYFVTALSQEGMDRMFFILLWPGRPVMSSAADALGDLLSDSIGDTALGAMITCCCAGVALFLTIEATQAQHSATTHRWVCCKMKTYTFALRTLQLFLLTFTARFVYSTYAVVVRILHKGGKPTEPEELALGWEHIFLTVAAPLFFVTLLRRRPGDTPFDTAVMDTLQFVVLFGWAFDHTYMMWTFSTFALAVPIDYFGRAGPSPPVPVGMWLWGMVLLGIAAAFARLRPDFAFTPLDCRWWWTRIWVMWAIQFCWRESWAGWTTVQGIFAQLLIVVSLSTWQVGIYQFTAKLRQRAEVERQEELSAVQGGGVAGKRQYQTFSQAGTPGVDVEALLADPRAAEYLEQIRRGAASVVPQTPLIARQTSGFGAYSPAPTLATWFNQPSLLAREEESEVGAGGDPSEERPIELSPCPPSVALTVSMLARTNAADSIQVAAPEPQHNNVAWGGAGYFASGLPAGSVGRFSRMSDGFSQLMT